MQCQLSHVASSDPSSIDNPAPSFTTADCPGAGVTSKKEHETVCGQSEAHCFNSLELSFPACEVRTQFPHPGEFLSGLDEVARSLSSRVLHMCPFLILGVVSPPP